MAKRKAGSQERIIRGSANVFADLGYSDAKERQTKHRLACIINHLINELCLTQAKTAEMLGIPQPHVSSLTRYKLDGFSVERLMTFLTALDNDVEISIRKRASSPAPGKIIIIAS